MKRARITLKNYRGFSDAEPVQIEIGPGFMALVGRNNSGKSALKLFFYEFRDLFSMFTNPLQVSPSLGDMMVRGWQWGFNYKGVSDLEEVFTNTNTRTLSVEIEVVRPEPYQAGSDCLARVVATCERRQPNVWRFATYGGRDPARDLSNVTPKPGSPMERVIALPEANIDCTDFMVVSEALRDARYYGPFRNAINQGSGEHFDLRVGTAFIELWNDWKTSGIRAKSRAIELVTDDIRNLFEFRTLEINASTKLSTLIVSIDRQPYRLNELGSGLAQFIMVLGNAATTRPSLLLIDEPETNLHPALQIDFLMALAQYATQGVIFSTHFVGLARSVADQIYSIQKQADRTIVRPFEATPNYLEFVGELSFSTFKDLGSDRLLLVEGVHDVKAVQQLLRLVKKEHTTVILPLGGDQLIRGDREAELRELTRLSAHIFALVDSERDSAAALPSAPRAQFAETCRRIGIDACLTQRRAIENYFPDRAVKDALGPAFAALAPFELLRDSAKPWSKADNWKIARQIQLTDLAGTDVGAFLDRF